MQVIRSIGKYHYCSAVMCDYDSLWVLIVQPIIIVYHQNNEICFCLSKSFLVYIFLSPLVLGAFNTLNYLFWYIFDDVMFSFLPHT